MLLCPHINTYFTSIKHLINFWFLLNKLRLAPLHSLTKIVKLRSGLREFVQVVSNLNILIFKIVTIEIFLILIKLRDKNIWAIIIKINVNNCRWFIGFSERDINLLILIIDIFYFLYFFLLLPTIINRNVNWFGLFRVPLFLLIQLYYFILNAFHDWVFEDLLFYCVCQK